jgi:hypothetical protein
MIPADTPTDHDPSTIATSFAIASRCIPGRVQVFTPRVITAEA